MNRSARPRTLQIRQYAPVIQLSGNNAFLFAFVPSLVLAQPLPVPPALAAKSWLLIESGSGQTLASQAEDERLEPASLTKLMTAYLTFAALKQGGLLVITVARPDTRLSRTLQKAGFEVSTEAVPASHKGKKTAFHTVILGKKGRFVPFSAHQS